MTFTSAMTPGEIDAVLDERAAAELRRDIEGMLATCTDDIRHEIVGGGPVAIGKQQVADHIRRAWRELEVSRTEIRRRHHGPDFVVDDVDVEAVAVGRPFGLEGGNRPIRFRSVVVFELREGQIATQTTWVDVGAVRAQLA